MSIINSEMKTAFRISLFGLACLIISLLLPAIQTKVLGSPTVFMGWQAMVWAFFIGADTFSDLLKIHTWEAIKLLALGISAMLNIVFVGVPVVLIRGTSTIWIWRTLTLVSLAGFLLATMAPLNIAYIHSSTLIGYYVWIFAYLMLMLALVLVNRRLRK